MLCKMKVKTNNHCSYCNGVVDFIEHFFFYCPIIRVFWKNIENFILAEYNTHLHIDVTDVIFGLCAPIHTTKENQKTLNHIILVGKMCISIFKKTNRHANMYSLFENQWQIRNT